MLSLLSILIPLISAVLLLLLTDQKARFIALMSSALSLLLVCLSGALFTGNGLWQHTFRTGWIKNPEIQLYFSMDQISWLMLLLSALTTFVAVFSAQPYTAGRPRLFYALLLLMQGATNGAFLSLDLFVYYICWELSLLPACILLLLWGKDNAQKVTLKFFLYTLAGSLFMLVAILWLGFSGSAASFSFEKLTELSLPVNTQIWLMIAFLLAYAVKSPLFPFHTWQAETYATSPVPLTMMLSGVMLKMALFSIIRWVYPLTPDAFPSVGTVIMWLTVSGIVYASVIAIRQNNMKKLFAWSSMAHVGLIAAGLLTLTEEGAKGAILQMVAHTLNAVAVLFAVHLLNQLKNSDELTAFGGLRRVDPFFGGIFLWFVFSFISVPLTAGFPGEILLLTSLFEWHAWSSVLAGLSVILGAVYMLRAYQLIMLGKADVSLPQQSEAPLTTRAQKGMLVVLGFLILVLGLFPQAILEWIDQPVTYIFQTYLPALQQ